MKRASESAREPMTDFTINANGTLTLLEATRRHCPDAAFVFTSTNKVYGDLPNRLPLVELERRWEIDPSHPFVPGIDESMSIDRSTHSLFGVSKASADLLVQEYGRYFGLKTVCFRAGCLTGPSHAGAVLHGFLAYLLKCACTGTAYTVFGYKGKQVRDNIHSHDVARFIERFLEKPRSGEIYNLGGGRANSCSILEAFARVEALTGKKMQWTYSEKNPEGDHICYISNLTKMRQHYPGWDITKSLDDVFAEIVEGWRKR